jgi:hypothetical protein
MDEAVVMQVGLNSKRSGKVAELCMIRILEDMGLLDLRSLVLSDDSLATPYLTATVEI